MQINRFSTNLGDIKTVKLMFSKETTKSCQNLKILMLQRHQNKAGRFYQNYCGLLRRTLNLQKNQMRLHKVLTPNVYRVHSCQKGGQYIFKYWTKFYGKAAGYSEVTWSNNRKTIKKMITWQNQNLSKKTLDKTNLIR